MIRVEGRVFDARESRGHRAWLTATAHGLRVEAESGASEELPFDPGRFSDRIGSIPRRVSLADGAVFETPDNDGIDALIRQSGGSGPGFVHWLEARWPVAVASLVAVLLFSAVLVRFGVPWLADRAAERVPDRLAQQIGDQALGLLDGRLLAPSRLPPARQAELQALFATMTRDSGAGYRLLLRDAPRLGPNAVALPAYTVVVTDALVALAEDDQELQAVIAHEMGHLEGRHSLRLLLRSAGVSVAAVVLFGDLSSVAAVGTAVPMLLDAKHSRDFEREADAHARRWLAANGIPADRFDRMLCRLAQSGDRPEVPGVMDYLASHPATAERARCP